MLKNVCLQILRNTTPVQENLIVFWRLEKHELRNRCYRNISSSSLRHSNEKQAEKEQSTELQTVDAKQIFQKEFSEYFSEGKFITRISYVDYIDQALSKMEELGLEENLEAYKELLKVFPPGKYWPKSRWDIGMFHAPQQLCALRVLHKLEQNKLRPDKEVEILVVQAFSKLSEVWLKVARQNYWLSKGRNIDNHPLPEKLPKKPHEMAKVALVRMLEDPKSLITTTNTSSLPDVIDKTWIVYSQSPLQREIIDKLDPKSILYVENQGLTYVGKQYLSYFVLKVYDDEKTIEKRQAERAKQEEPDYNFNTVKMKFFGKPIKEKLQEMESIHHVDNAHILGICITGTSSQDSLLSWLKILQRRNPKLKDLNVVFKTIRPTLELLDPSNDPKSSQRRQDASS